MVEAEVPKAFNQSLEIFFKSGFLYGVEEYLKKTDPTYSQHPSIQDLNVLEKHRVYESADPTCRSVFFVENSPNRD